MKDIKLSLRLTAAAELCRKNSFIADVGTDHAYLPIYLAQKGIIRGGVVSDIHKGPIEKARANIAAHGLSDMLTPIHCDGLEGLEGFAPEDIFILGMGGELIARIITDAPFLKRKGTRLILQPMTHPEILRRSLNSQGFKIIEEKLIKEEKIYQLLSAEYVAESEEYSAVELMFGKINIAEGSPLLAELLAHTERVILDRVAGKKKADADTSEEENFLKEIEKLK